MGQSRKIGKCLLWMIVHGLRVGRRSGIGSRDSRRLICDCSLFFVSFIEQFHDSQGGRYRLLPCLSSPLNGAQNQDTSHKVLANNKQILCFYSLSSRNLHISLVYKFRSNVYRVYINKHNRQTNRSIISHMYIWNYYSNIRNNSVLASHNSTKSGWYLGQVKVRPRNTPRTTRNQGRYQESTQPHGIPRDNRQPWNRNSLQWGTNPAITLLDWPFETFGETQFQVKYVGGDTLGRTSLGEVSL